MIAHETPFAHFDAWFADARGADPQPEAAALASADGRGRPSNRLVLVRNWSERGWEVHTNLESRKGRELLSRPWAALTWHWKPLGRQVRVEGMVERMADEESDAYWRARPRESQVSAVASDQSEPIADRAALERRRQDVARAYPDGVEVPRPVDWGGLRVVPLRVEFWQHADDRFHDRLEYTRDAVGEPWRTRVLQP